MLNVLARPDLSQGIPRDHLLRSPVGSPGVLRGAPHLRASVLWLACQTGSSGPPLSKGFGPPDAASVVLVWTLERDLSASWT